MRNSDFSASSAGSPYVGICSKCGKLVDLDTSTALCEKCSDPKTKKEGSNGG